MFGSDVSNMVVTTTYVVFNDHLDIVSMLPVDSRDKEAAVKAAPPEARTGYFCDHTKIVTEVDGIKRVTPLGYTNMGGLFIVH